MTIEVLPIPGGPAISMLVPGGVVPCTSPRTIPLDASLSDLKIGSEEAGRPLPFAVAPKGTLVNLPRRPSSARQPADKQRVSSPTGAARSSATVTAGVIACF